MREQMSGTLFIAVEDGEFQEVETTSMEWLADYPAREIEVSNVHHPLTYPFDPLTFRVEARSWDPLAVVATLLFEPDWLATYPGRRLPGGFTNERLAKKRAQYLERWAREVGLA